jgi:GT2 family glycosyltransferase
MLVDGHSPDGSADYLHQQLADAEFQSWVSFLPLSRNGGFGWANNQAILTLGQSAEPPRFVYLLNPDAEVHRGALSTLYDHLAAYPNCAAAGSQLLNEAGCPTSSSFRFPSIGTEFVRGCRAPKLGKFLGIPSLPIEQGSRCVDWVTGASVMIRLEAMADCGLFDDGFFLYFEEVELMHRFRQRGWQVRHVPESQVTHLEGAATGLGAGADKELKRLPAYWFASRRRYFTRTLGPVRAVFASLAWASGHVLWKMRALGGRDSRGGGVMREGRDLLAHGILPTADDLVSSATLLGDPIGRPPLWSLSR